MNTTASFIYMESALLEVERSFLTRINSDIHYKDSPAPLLIQHFNMRWRTPSLKVVPHFLQLVTSTRKAVRSLSSYSTSIWVTYPQFEGRPPFQPASHVHDKASLASLLVQHIIGLPPDGVVEMGRPSLPGLQWTTVDDVTKENIANHWPSFIWTSMV